MTERELESTGHLSTIYDISWPWRSQLGAAADRNFITKYRYRLPHAQAYHLWFNKTSDNRGIFGDRFLIKRTSEIAKNAKFPLHPHSECLMAGSNFILQTCDSWKRRSSHSPRGKSVTYILKSIPSCKGFLNNKVFFCLTPVRKRALLTTVTVTYKFVPQSVEAAHIHARIQCGSHVDQKKNITSWLHAFHRLPSLSISSWRRLRIWHLSQCIQLQITNT